jgi:uncharacterized protein YdiU (UPF0061 family)
MDFTQSYRQLPSAFYRDQPLQPVAAPQLLLFNEQLAAQLGATGLTAAHLSGSELPAGAQPLAMAYAGHQFAHFVPLLGDGRALLLGELKGFDLHLKGSGPTAFARRGDGRAALAPMLREYIISEAMYALGIPTTRSLAVVASGETVQRQSAEPGGVLARIAASHLRVGTFQFAAQQGVDAVQALLDYSTARHYPDAHGPEEFLAAVSARQAKLIAQWLLVGFIHGVMNTDNMAISGETIDYGPCAFMDVYDPATVFSSIDKQGRYAYGNQPAIAAWNLARLADTLLPLMNDDVAKAEAILADFVPQLEQHWLAGMRAKLGLLTEQDDDVKLIQDWLALLQAHGADYTNSHRQLGDVLLGRFTFAPAYSQWLTRWQARLAYEPLPAAQVAAGMHKVNPAYIARNHRTEQALQAAVRGDLTLLHKLLEVLAQPFAEQSEHAAYRELPTPAERVYQTFCGT